MTLATIRSGALKGIDGLPVDVEVDIGSGLPAFNIVGLPDTAVQEARERVRSAIRNAGFEFPLRRITVNLAPADPRTTTLHASDSFRRSEVRRMRSLSRIGSSGSPPLTSQRRVGAEQWGSI